MLPLRGMLSTYQRHAIDVSKNLAKRLKVEEMKTAGEKARSERVKADYNLMSSFMKSVMASTEEDHAPRQQERAM
jgi:hypothetical protein